MKEAYIPNKSYDFLMNEMDELKRGVEVTLFNAETQRSQKKIENGATAPEDRPKRVSLKKNKQVQTNSGQKEASR